MWNKVWFYLICSSIIWKNLCNRICNNKTSIDAFKYDKLPIWFWWLLVVGVWNLGFCLENRQCKFCNEPENNQNITWIRRSTRRLILVCIKPSAHCLEDHNTITINWSLICTFLKIKTKYIYHLRYDNKKRRRLKYITD